MYYDKTAQCLTSWFSVRSPVISKWSPNHLIFKYLLIVFLLLLTSISQCGEFAISIYTINLTSPSHAMAQVVCHMPLTVESHIQSQASPCGICCRQSGTGVDFSLSTALFLVSIIPPILHSHPLIYHQHHTNRANNTVK